MSQTRFTPGPWMPGHITRDDHPCECRHILAEGYMGSVAQVSVAKDRNDCPPLEEAKANAHLIAASPDLFAALDLLVKDVADYEAWQRPCYALDVAQAALAKARGEQS